ncbi:MAG: hypothetical protein Fur003_3740 [Candidatus Dojkabacteria bacterium]
MQERTLILNKVRKLSELFKKGEIPQQHQHELNPGIEPNDRINYLYFTLPVSLNFQRSSPAMWRAAMATYDDPATNYLFYPETVVTTPWEKVQNDLLKHKLSLQRNKHTEIWTRLSKTFVNYFDADPRKFFEMYDYDIAKTIPAMQKERKRDFPYLSGNKMANYWHFILHHYTDANFKNLDQISIIPDTHVLQSSIVLGLSDEKSSPIEVAQRWFDLLEASEFKPIDLHSILWNWSRNNFKPEV